MGPGFWLQLEKAEGFGFAAIFHTIAPRTHWFASDLPYQQAQAKTKGPLPRGSSASHGAPQMGRAHSPLRRN